MKTNNKYNPDMMLSDDYRLGEFCESETARLLGIDNRPSATAVAHLRQLCCEVVQPLRDHYGLPIAVRSGYRSEALNEALHGVGASLHLIGCAADLEVPDIDTARRWYLWVVNHLDFDQLVLEHDADGHCWLHVSHCPDFKQNRHQCWFYHPAPPRP